MRVFFLEPGNLYLYVSGGDAFEITAACEHPVELVMAIPEKADQVYLPLERLLPPSSNIVSPARRSERGLP